MTREEFKARVSMSYGDPMTWDEHLEAVWQLHLQASNHWIPVEERLPEPGKDVLVWSSEFDEPMVGCFKHWNWQRKQHMFYVHNDRNMWGNVTHWMPLPQPPRKEANNDCTTSKD